MPIILSFAYHHSLLVVVFFFFVSILVVVDLVDDSRPVFIKAGCDRNHPKVDFCPRYDNPALTRLDRLLGPSPSAPSPSPPSPSSPPSPTCSLTMPVSRVILTSSVSSFLSWRVMAFSSSLVERHASEL